MEHFTKSVAFCLVLHGASALATEGPILDRLMGVIPPGEYVGLNDSGHCSLKVTNQELNGVNVEIFEEGALREDGSIDPTKWLAFPFAETDEVAVHSESFGAGEAFLEYTYNPADQVSGTFIRTLNLDQDWISLKEKKKGLFSTLKSKECKLFQPPF